MDKIIINSYIKYDPLHENNLDEVLNLIQEIREKFPEKTIWLYTGYEWSKIMNTIIMQPVFSCKDLEKRIEFHLQRQNIIKLCDIVVDGEYIDEQNDVTLKWRGSKNQQVIDVKQSLAQNKIVLYCD